VPAFGKPQIFQLLRYGPKSQEVADFHNSAARTLVPNAPARTSKSFSAAKEVVYAAFPPFDLVNGLPVFQRDPSGDRYIWLVGPDYKTLKEWDYVWEDLVTKRRKHGFDRFYKIKTKANSAQQGNLRITLDFGRDVHGDPVFVHILGKSATNPESLQGEQVYLAVLSEAAEMESKILARYLGTRCQRVILPTTPKASAEWLRVLIAEGQEHPELSIESFTFTPNANPLYDWDLYWIEHQKAESRVHGRILSAARSHDCFANLAQCPAAQDPWFAEQFQGQWTGADERLLPFTDAHVLNEVPAWSVQGADGIAPRHFVSVDYGYADACVALYWAVGPREQYVLLSEIYERELTATEFVKRIHERSHALGIRPDYYVGDPKQPQVARLMQERGLPVWATDKNAMASRQAGGMALVDALSTDPTLLHPRLRVVSEKAGFPFGCPKLIREWRLLVRRKDTSSREWETGAIQGDDHAFDAARYGIQTRPKPKALVPQDEIREYVRSLARKQRRTPGPSLLRAVGGVPRMNAHA
jgi:hypothetical protein